MIQGDHLVAQLLGYKHHGLYLGNEHVMQYTGPSTNAPVGLIECVSLATFAEGGTVTVLDHPRRRYGREASIERAWSRHREAEYGLWGNNCEHFVFWCIEGEHVSVQTAGLALGMIEAGKAAVAHAKIGRAVTMAAASAELIEAYSVFLASPQLAVPLGSLSKCLSNYARKRKAPFDQIEFLQRSIDAMKNEAAALTLTAGAALAASAIDAVGPALQRLQVDLAVTPATQSDPAKLLSEHRNPSGES